jgi:serine/threonine-protein kinase
MDDFSRTSWQEVDDLLDAALDRPPEERTAFLDEACEGRPELRAKVASLLEAEEQAGALFDEEAVDFAGPAYDPDDNDGLTADPLARPDRRIGGYQLGDEIGRGGMSRVFRAERTDDAFEQTVAVKLLRIGLDTPAARRRFRVEQQVLATLRHPHIARLLDGGVTDDDVPYLVMEYVDGVPITTYCDNNTLSVEERVALLQDVGEALRHAHHNLVVHRDLKPSNVLVTPEGTVKLLDFSIAKLLDESETPVTVPATRTGVRPMTPAYAAPEQVRGASVSTATDVYQLGVLAYEILTGHRPFEGDERGDVEQAILETDPARLSTVITQESEESDDETGPDAISTARDTSVRQLRHTLEGDLDTIVRAALRKEPERRYASVRDLMDDLDRYQSGQPVEARSATIGYRTKKFMQRNRWGVVVAAVFLATVVGFGTMLVQQRNRAQREAQKAEIVSDYLVDLFGAGAPAQTTDTLLARDLVRRGLSRVDRLRDRPLVQAEMLDALGQAARGLGNWSQADSLLSRALALRRRHLEPPHPALVASLVHVARAKWTGQRVWEARPLYEKALAMSRDLGRSGHRASSLEGLAQTLAVQGDPDSAEVLMRRAIEERRQSQPGTGYHELPLDQMELARIVQRQGRAARAEELYRAGLQRMREASGFTPVERARAYHAFGTLLRAKEEYGAAQAYYQKTLTVASENLGRNHPWARRARSNLYRLEIRLGEYQSALALARAGLAVAKQQYETPYYPITEGYQRVGHLLDNIGRSAEARPLLRKATALRREARGPDHLWTHSTRVRWALCLAETGRLDQAERMLRETGRALQQTQSDSTVVDVRRMRAVQAVAEGRLYGRRGEWRRAIQRLQRGYRLRRRQIGLRAPLTQRALRHLAAAHEAVDQTDRARAYRDSLMAR